MIYDNVDLDNEVIIEKLGKSNVFCEVGTVG